MWNWTGSVGLAFFSLSPNSFISGSFGSQPGPTGGVEERSAFACFIAIPPSLSTNPRQPRWKRSQHGITNNEELDMCHAKYFALLEKKRFIAPIGENPQKILDLGCGTGTLSVPCAGYHA